ncbi:MAG: hypothetical protein V4671_21175 [Armatimonadota bacterium]
MEAEYQERRSWFLSNYPQRIQRIVESFLPSETDESMGSDAMTGFWSQRLADPFESLYLPGSISAMLAADGGNLITRLMQTQEALGGWDGHIARQEAALKEVLRLS